ncbi:M15 family metallopeptidase [Litorihabitans aurantiacus]|uniref:D-alanyl-D-alanine carboxypeptidase-like core domain-containing protein n=1 Tax=Litorihabitans aurantiacus TaxID=1930061 RepID=A0AA37XEJ3_9MICO|nr:M15 family metallopeptidase [Litorihabitans aurantiacus]GMA31768.1 hypothetical protein GCM10025875_17600 [Litorihabitans aurantiacus]
MAATRVPGTPRTPGGTGTQHRSRRTGLAVLVLAVAAGTTSAAVGERSLRADRVEQARATASVTARGIEAEVTAARSDLETEIAAASAVLAGTDAETGSDDTAEPLGAAPPAPGAPAEPSDPAPTDTPSAAGVAPEPSDANADVDPATVEELRRTLEDARTRLDGPVTVTTQPEVVERVEVDVPVGASPSVDDVSAAASSLVAAADAVRQERASAARDHLLAALTTAEERLATWEPLAADPAGLDDLRAAVAAGIEVRDGGQDLDVAGLRERRTALETVTAAHPEIVVSPDAPTTVGGIPVISKALPLPLGYDPGMSPEVEAAFAEMATAAQVEAGLTLFVASGYRSYDDQRVTYERWSSSHGATYADRFSSRAGFSEHQSGLALDVNDPSRAFDGTPEALWVAANAHRFGFVVRYPEGKEAVTGYVWEPWHLRHLGVELATELTEAGLTLEEHLGLRADYEASGNGG